MSEIHDQYYAVLTDAPALVEELEKYMTHITQCLEEQGITDECKKDLQEQYNAAVVVRENIRRVFDE